MANKKSLSMFLASAAKAERAGGKMYEKYAEKARKSGYEDIAKAFEATAKSEYGHEKLMKSLSENLKSK